MAAVLNETELKYCADNIELCCTVDLCYDVIIVCTGNASQEKYWQERLEKGLGVFFPKSSIVLAVHEDWVGGAGNGLGTLYAYKKACLAANARDIDLPKMLKDAERHAQNAKKRRSTVRTLNGPKFSLVKNDFLFKMFDIFFPSFFTSVLSIPN